MIKKLTAILNTSAAEIRGQSRQKYMVEKRISACHVLSKMGFSTTQVGGIINRDHTTVIHLLKKACPVDVDVILRRLVAECKDNVFYDWRKQILSLEEKGVPSNEILDMFPDGEERAFAERLLAKNRKNEGYYPIYICELRKIPNYKTHQTEIGRFVIKKDFRRFPKKVQLQAKEMGIENRR